MLSSTLTVTNGVSITPFCKYRRGVLALLPAIGRPSKREVLDEQGLSRALDEQYVSFMKLVFGKSYSKLL